MACACLSSDHQSAPLVSAAFERPRPYSRLPEAPPLSPDYCRSHPAPCTVSRPSDDAKQVTSVSFELDQETFELVSPVGIRGVVRGRWRVEVGAPASSSLDDSTNTMAAAVATTIEVA
jgi:hypothetical protein